MSVVRQEEATDAQTFHNKRAVKAKSGMTGTVPSVFLLFSNSDHFKRQNSASSSVISA